jgi:ribosomal protein S18 acetylase RimI-like enzyme
MALNRPKDWEWRKSIKGEEYLISTALHKIDRNFVNNAFESADTYWAKPVPQDQLEMMLANSMTLALYHVVPAIPPAKDAGSPSSPRTPSPTMENDSMEQLKQIGMARVVTDYITMAYLTDVYILPECRALGLGKWLIECCADAFDAIPAMRRTLLMTSSETAKTFYANQLGMSDILNEKEHLSCMTRRYFKMD